MQGLSERSTYFRFFFIPRSADREVHRLVACDGLESAALVAEFAGRLVGVASFVRQPERPNHAEVAFAVADVAQGHGIGTQLLVALSEVARHAGIDTFEADVLGDNHQMLQVFRGSGFTIRLDLDAGVYHSTLDLRTLQPSRPRRPRTHGRPRPHRCGRSSRPRPSPSSARLNSAARSARKCCTT